MFPASALDVSSFCLGCMLIPCHIINFKPWFDPNWAKFVYFGTFRCIFKDFKPGCQTVYVKGIPHNVINQEIPLVQAIMTFILTDTDSAILNPL